MWSRDMVCVILCMLHYGVCSMVVFFFFQAEDGIRDLVRSRGLGDVYKRQMLMRGALLFLGAMQLIQLHKKRDLFAMARTLEPLSLIHI